MEEHIKARIVKSVKRIMPSGSEIEHTLIEVSGENLSECRKHFDELLEEKK